jgi:hypothetical protein
MSKRDGDPGFAPEHAAPIPYMRRIRDYYQGLGYARHIAGRIIPRCLFGRCKSRLPSAGLR